MSNRNKGSFKNALSGDWGKNGNCGFVPRNCVPFFGGHTAPDNGMEQKIPRELMLVAALRGGGDPQ
jgi:hypothetical protein